MEKVLSLCPVPAARREGLASSVCTEDAKASLLATSRRWLETVASLECRDPNQDKWSGPRSNMVT